jgi:hypothetical protein
MLSPKDSLPCHRPANTSPGTCSRGARARMRPHFPIGTSDMIMNRPKETAPVRRGRSEKRHVQQR